MGLARFAGRAPIPAASPQGVSWGQAPALQSPLPTPLDSGPVSGYGACFRGNDELRGRNDEGTPRLTDERLLEQSIPDRSPGNAFVPMKRRRI